MSLSPYLIAITVPTAVLYDLLLYVIFRERKKYFNSAFFVLFISTGIADTLYLWHRVFMTHLPILFFADVWIKWADDLLLPTIANCFEWYISYVQILGLIAMSVNRLIAIAFPLRYNALWKTHAVRYLVIAQWILPISVIIPMWTPCCYSVYANDDIDLLQLEYNDSNSAYSLLDFIFEIIFCTPVIIFLNTFTIVVSVRDRKQRSLPSSEKTRKKAELHLAIFNLVSSLSFITYNVFSFLWWMGDSGHLSVNVDLMSNWYYNFYDVFTLCNPYLILFMCKVARERCISFLTCDRY